MKERATSPLNWPQVFIFAEGTTSNGRALARFGTGGFQPGVPVQPVTIQYSCPQLTVWTRSQGHRFIHSLFLILCCPFNKVTLEFLPVYTPTEEEKENPIIFANNVQDVMAKSLGIEATSFVRPEFLLNNNKKEK